MLWRQYTLARSAYFGLYAAGFDLQYWMNVALRPATVVLLFGYVASTVASGADVRRVAVGASILVLNWNAIGGPLMTLGWELGNGTLGINLASPVRRVAFIASRALLHIPNGLLAVFFAITAGTLVFDLDLSDTTWSIALPAVLLIVLSFNALGLVCGVFSLALREVTAFLGVSGAIVYLLTGGIVPLAQLPAPMEALSVVIPGRWGIAALQDALHGESFASAWPMFLSEVAVGLSYFIAAVLLFLWYERRAKVNGSADVV